MDGEDRGGQTGISEGRSPAPTPSKYSTDITFPLNMWGPSLILDSFRPVFWRNHSSLTHPPPCPSQTISLIPPLEGGPRKPQALFPSPNSRPQAPDESPLLHPNIPCSKMGGRGLVSLSRRQSQRRYLGGQRHVAGDRGCGTGVGVERKRFAAQPSVKRKRFLVLSQGPLAC